MKGVVITGFLKILEQEFGLKVVNTIIEKSDMASEGIYTSDGISIKSFDLLKENSTDVNFEIISNG